KIAMLSFGGGSALWAHRVLVEELGWLDADEFLKALGLCQLLPGANLINLSAHIGARFQGAAGALVGVLGIVLVPFVIIVGLAARRHGGDAAVIASLGTLAGYFAVLSLMAIGGGSSIVPDMHRFVVAEQAWLTDQQFADVYALARASSGPTTLIVAVIGLKVA